MFSLIAILAVFVLPIGIGAVLRLVWPALGKLRVAVVSAIPGVLVTLGLAVLAYTSVRWDNWNADGQCVVEAYECGAGPVWFYVLLAMSVVIGLLGGVLGWVGSLLAASFGSSLKGPG